MEYVSDNKNDMQDSSITGELLRSILIQINESMLMSYVQSLVSIGPRYTGTEHCRNAADYLQETFLSMGLWTKRTDWTYKGFSSENVYATLNGTDTSTAGMVIICAHYDTVLNSPGATDNAVGVATVLAAAEILRQYSFNYSIRFLALSGEEIGLFGSYCYVKAAYERSENILAVLNVDENGFAYQENEHALFLQHPQRAEWMTQISEDICNQYPDLINLTIIHQPYYEFSDHASFHNYGYDAMFYLSVDWNTPWVHSAEDTLDKVNTKYHLRMSRLIIATLASIAHTQKEVQVIIKNPTEGGLYLSNQFLTSIECWDAGSFSRIVPTVLLGSTIISAEILSSNDVVSVDFYIDEKQMYSDTTPPYEWKIQPQNSIYFGRYDLQVKATTISGSLGADSMDVTMVIF